MNREKGARNARSTRLGTHGTLWVLATVVVAVVVTLAGVTLLRNARVRHDLTDARARYLAPSRHLANAQRATFAQERDAHDLFDGSTTGSDRAATVFALDQDARAVTDEWASYTRNAAGVPGERRLQAQFSEGVDGANAVVSGYLAGTGTSDALELYGTALAQQHGALTDLRVAYATALDGAVARANEHATVTGNEVLWVAVGCGALLLVLFGVAIGRARDRERVIREHEREQARQAERNVLETRLGHALEMATAEPAVYGLVTEALEESAVDVQTDLLVADPRGDHLRRVATTDPASTGCGVELGAECPAASRGRTEVFPSSREFDACPYLRASAEGPCAAVCVPVSIAGASIGVLHATAADREPPDRDAIASLELVARRAGERIGMLRAFARSEMQARTDPLTGLLNRRSLESEARLALSADSGYVVAYADLDHFKRLNDEHGHDAGDRALRLFARVLRDGVRPNDLPARYGGEEFLVVLPDCALDDAVAVVERIRERLRDAQSAGSGPSFTVSFGLAASDPVDTFAETVERADAALLRAKAAGRDRTVVDGAPDGPDGGGVSGRVRLREVS